MNYHKAFIKLYGAAATALDELDKAGAGEKEIYAAIRILKNAIRETEEMDDEKHSIEGRPLAVRG